MEKNELWEKRKRELLETLGEVSGVIKHALYAIPLGNNEEDKQELMRADRELERAIGEIGEW